MPFNSANFLPAYFLTFLFWGFGFFFFCHLKLLFSGKDTNLTVYCFWIFSHRKASLLSEYKGRHTSVPVACRLHFHGSLTHSDFILGDSVRSGFYFVFFRTVNHICLNTIVYVFSSISMMLPLSYNKFLGWILFLVML